MKKQHVIFVGTFLAVVAVFWIGSSLYQKQKAQERGFLAQQNAAVFVRPWSQSIGAPEAKVFLTEFTDPACETCASFSPMLKKLVDAHPGKIRLVVRYAPLHPGSDAVVRLLHASIQQGRFWQTLDLMYRTQSSWTQNHQAKADLLLGPLIDEGVDTEKLRRDAADPSTTQAVEQDMADARAVGVKATPEFFVNGKPLPTWGYPQLEALVNAELALQYPR